jgi:hypothetical protein
VNYWPLSVIKDSPLMSPAYATELHRVYATLFLSGGAFLACSDVARHTAPRSIPNLALIETIGAPPRQVYTEYPDWEEWFGLERGAVIEGSNGVLYVIIDGLH